MNFYLPLFCEHYRDFKVALAVYYSVKTNSVKFYIDKNPKVLQLSVKLHHLGRTGTIGKRYLKIIKYIFVIHTKVAVSNARMDMNGVH